MSALLNYSLRRFFQSSATRRAVEGPSAVSGGHGGGYKLWRNLSFFVGFPCVGLCMINAYLKHQEDHHKPRPEYIKYEYLGIRTKKFPWGDGNHSLFHNPRVNALPDGYEDE